MGPLFEAKFQNSGKRATQERHPLKICEYNVENFVEIESDTVLKIAAFLGLPCI